VSHHVLNDYCSKKLVRNDFRAINHFCPLIRLLIIRSIIYLKISSNVALYSILQ
jgi:hypothetical protein